MKMLQKITAKPWGWPVLILLLGCFIAILLMVFQKSPPRVSPKKIAARVSVLSASPSNEHIRITGYGSVMAKKLLEVRPQVLGHIKTTHANLQIGGRIKKGESLIQIDPRDYEIFLEAEKANVARAEFALKLEKGSQIVAEREWSLVEKEITVNKLGRELVLRKPHLKEKEAAFLAAKSRLKKAQLDLERTNIIAPFNGVIIEESVEEGQYVSPQTSILRFAAIDEFYIEVKIARKDLAWLDFSDPSAAQNNSIRVFQRLGNDQQLRWEGKFIRFLADVDPLSRLARVLIAVKDPLVTSEEQQALLLGSYVRVEMPGKELQKVYRLPRRVLREGDVLWLAQDNMLHIQAVTVLFKQGEDIFIQSEMTPGTLIITSPMKNVLEGMLLEIAKKEVEN